MILDRFTDSPIPYWDAFTTALSFTATWMLARKILEHWILWIIVDAVSMGLYLYRGLYPTLVVICHLYLHGGNWIYSMEKDTSKYRRELKRILITGPESTGKTESGELRWQTF